MPFIVNQEHRGVAKGTISICDANMAFSAPTLFSVQTEMETKYILYIIHKHTHTHTHTHRGYWQHSGPKVCIKIHWGTSHELYHHPIPTFPPHSLQVPCQAPLCAHLSPFSYCVPSTPSFPWLPPFKALDHVPPGSKYTKPSKVCVQHWCKVETHTFDPWPRCKPPPQLINSLSLFSFPFFFLFWCCKWPF